MQLLKNHTSPDSAYVVDDYPYGYTLRCKIRYWLEYNAKHGFRFVSQTTNPKRPGEVWNKPKASTYAKLGGAMFLDDNGHVQWSGLSEYSGGAEAKAWFDIYGAAIPEAGLEMTKRWIAAKTAYDAARAPLKAEGQDPDLTVGLAEARKAFVAPVNYRFVETDNGNCRVYYRDGQKTRCFQEDRRGVFTFYVCSSDGEPEYEAKPAMGLDKLPDDDSATAQAFRAWWQALGGGLSNGS